MQHQNQNSSAHVKLVNIESAWITFTLEACCCDILEGLNLPLAISIAFTLAAASAAASRLLLDRWFWGSSHFVALVLSEEKNINLQHSYDHIIIIFWKTQHELSLIILNSKSQLESIRIWQAVSDNFKPLYPVIKLAMWHLENVLSSHIHLFQPIWSNFWHPIFSVGRRLKIGSQSSG